MSEGFQILMSHTEMGRSEMARSRDGAVVRALAFHQCVPGLIPGPGARFSKLPVITGPVKLFCFPFQMGVSKVLKITQ